MYYGGCQYQDCGDGCGFRTSEYTPEDGVLIEALRGASSIEELAAFMGDFGHRVLLSEKRGVVVILSGCEGTAPSSLVQVTAEKLEALRELGGRSLQEFLGATTAD